MAFQNLSNGYCMRGLRVFKHHKVIFYKHVVFPSGTGLFASIFLSVFTAISSHKKMISSTLGDKIKALCFSFRQEYSWDSPSFQIELKTIFLGFALRPFAIGYFEFPLLQT